MSPRATPLRGLARFALPLALAALGACDRSPPAPDPAPVANGQPPAAIAPPADPPAPAVPSPAPSALVLTPSGYDTVRYGVTPEAAGYDLRDDGNYDGECRIYVTDRLPGFSVMVEDGLIRRVTLHQGRTGTSSIPTARGIRVGSSEADVRAAYSPLGDQPHDYAGPIGRNLYWGEEGVPEALRFETDDNRRVTDIHAGQSPWLQYAEGCS